MVASGIDHFAVTPTLSRRKRENAANPVSTLNLHGREKSKDPGSSINNVEDDRRGSGERESHTNLTKLSGSDKDVMTLTKMGGGPFWVHSVKLQ